MYQISRSKDLQKKGIQNLPIRVAKKTISILQTLTPSQSYKFQLLIPEQ